MTQPWKNEGNDFTICRPSCRYFRLLRTYKRGFKYRTIKLDKDKKEFLRRRRKIKLIILRKIVIELLEGGRDTKS